MLPGSVSSKSKAGSAVLTPPLLDKLCDSFPNRNSLELFASISDQKIVALGAVSFFFSIFLSTL